MMHQRIEPRPLSVAERALAELLDDMRAIADEISLLSEDALDNFLKLKASFVLRYGEHVLYRDWEKIELYIRLIDRAQDRVSDRIREYANPDAAAGLIDLPSKP